MKKSGFTLAELLITLSIIGVIAAVTIPSLSNNINKSQVGPALMKAVNTLENANELAMRSTDTSDLLQHAIEAGVDGASYLSVVLTDFTGITKVEYTPSNNALSKEAVGGTYFYGTKDGIVFKNGSKGADQNATLTAAIKPTTRLSGKYYNIYVDVNGSKPPNTEGKDIFNLMVDTKGRVIPYGSNSHSGYKNKMPSWVDACPSKTQSDSTITNAAACAGSIVENGGRILYDYESIPIAGKEKK